MSLIRPQKTEETVESNQPKADPKYVQRLENEVEFLREELRRKDDQIQQILPGETQEEEDEFKGLGLVQVIKRWFTTKT